MFEKRSGSIPASARRSIYPNAEQLSALAIGTEYYTLDIKTGKKASAQSSLWARCQAAGIKVKVVEQEGEFRVYRTE